MKIAVTYNNGQIFQHFGHTETFKVYQVKDGKVASSAILDSSGGGHGALASLLGARAWTPSSAAASAGSQNRPGPGRSHPLRRGIGQRRPGRDRPAGGQAHLQPRRDVQPPRGASWP